MHTFSKQLLLGLFASALWGQSVGLSPAYNAPAEVSVQKQKNVYAVARFIYWQPVQDNMELGIVGDTSNALDFINGTFVNLDFEFTPGFQTGIGYHLPRDNWDVYVEYTWLRHADSVSRSLNTSNSNIGLYPIWEFSSIAGPHYFSGRETWQLHMDIIDAQLGRSYYVGEKLVFRPFAGLRAPWIRQRLSAAYINRIGDPSQSTFTRQLFYSWGLGARAGLLLDWLLGYGITFRSQVGADVVYTEYRKLHLRQQTMSSAVIVNSSRYIIHQDPIGVLRPHVDLTLGLGWSRCALAETKSWQGMLAADYTFQIFFDQNMLRSFHDDQSVAKSSFSNGNLYIQGLTATVRLDF